MKSQITINYLNGKSETYRFVLDEDQSPKQLKQRCEALFGGNLLTLRVQDETLEENDRLLMIPFSSIESISLNLPIKEYGFSNVLFVNPESAEKS